MSREILPENMVVDDIREDDGGTFTVRLEVCTSDEWGGMLRVYARGSGQTIDAALRSALAASSRGEFHD